jgi:hypothetical protein
MSVPLISILSILGFSGPAGLNAYLPLLIVGLTARFTTWLTLVAPWDLLTNDISLGVLGLLVALELLVDKVPGVSAVNQVVSTLVRPVAGAIVALAETSSIGVDPTVAAGVGLTSALTVHGAKVGIRSAAAAVPGLGCAFSILEDVLTAAIVIITILAPVIGIILVVALVVGLVLGIRAVSRRVFRRAGGPGGASAPSG